MSIKLFFAFTFSLLFLGCPDDGITPPANPLQVVDATCTEVYLNISLSGAGTVTLQRGDVSIATITLTGSDSLFVDSLLQSNQTYTYTLTDGNWRVTAQATTLDTTSHEIQWQAPDTLGVQGLIRDVWVFSETNAWAVGEIYLADSTGKPDMGNPYNAAHWDGSKWEVKQIKVNFRGNMITPPLEGIFAFSPTQIWLVGSLPIFGDGSTWIMYDLRTTLHPNVSVSKAWGSNAQNMYFVGSGGSTVHYSNGTWTKMESHTTVNLQDIWGIDNSHVWATGFNSNDGHSVVLQFDGKQWTTLYDSDTQSFQTKYQFSRVWSDISTRIYLDGGSGLHTMNLNNFNISPQIHTGRTFVSYCLRGTGLNDIFDGGPAGELSHGNGYSWHLYPEFNTLNQGDAWVTSIHPKKNFVLVGGLYLTQLNGFPVVIRGYR